MKISIFKKKIAYITGTRADYGLMSPVLKAIKNTNTLQLQLFATGIHLMPEFGHTIAQIKKDFDQVVSINAIFGADDRTGMAFFSGVFLERAVEALRKYNPDIVLVLGDRVEMLCTALACLYLGIPVAHIHGGDKTTTVDEQARHAITKLSHIHFPATKKSAERIKRMGEESWRINTVGTPALDVILHERLPARKDFFPSLGLDPNEPVVLVTQHPVSEEWEQAGRQMKETLAAIKKIGLPTVVIYPHADAGGIKMIMEINKEKNNSLIHVFPSLSFTDFLSLERESVLWIGNSSAGIIESASFKTPVINVGDRQKGRERTKNIIDVGYDRNAIVKAANKALSSRFRKTLEFIQNPWGDGNTSSRIVEILENIPLNARLINKKITY